MLDAIRPSASGRHPRAVRSLLGQKAGLTCWDERVKRLFESSAQAVSGESARSSIQSSATDSEFPDLDDSTLPTRSNSEEDNIVPPECEYRSG